MGFVCVGTVCISYQGLTQNQLLYTLCHFVTCHHSHYVVQLVEVN